MAKKKREGHTVDPDRLKEFAEQYSSSRQEITDLASEHSGLMKRIGEAGINKAALKLVMKLAGMDLLKAQDFVRSLQTYSRILGLQDRLASQPDMLDEAEAAEETSQGHTLQ